MMAVQVGPLSRRRLSLVQFGAKRYGVLSDDGAGVVLAAAVCRNSSFRIPFLPNTISRAGVGASQSLLLAESAGAPAAFLPAIR